MEQIESGTERKVCLSCGKKYPATAEFFRRSGKQPDALAQSCKTCAKNYTRNYYTVHADIKGVLGFHCPLHALRCGVCNTVSHCWRLEGHWETTDERPAKLRSDPIFVLKKKSKGVE